MEEWADIKKKKKTKKSGSRSKKLSSYLAVKKPKVTLIRAVPVKTRKCKRTPRESLSKKYTKTGCSRSLKERGNKIDRVLKQDKSEEGFFKESKNDS